MQKPPQFDLERVPLAQRVADILRNHIASGILADPFPGEGSLAAQLGVSRPVLRQALQELSREKLIVIANGKRTRLVKKLRSVSRSRQRHVLVLSPFSFRCPSREGTSQIIEEIRQLLQSKGCHWSEFHDPRLRFAAGISLLEEVVGASSCDCLLLLGTSKAIQKWAVGQPVSSFVLGSLFPGISLPAVDSDYHALGWHAAGRLAAAGHRRVALLCRKTLLRGDQATREGIQAFFDRHSQFPCEISIHHLPENIEETCHLLERMLRKNHPPTALMPFYPADTVTVVTYLLKTGRRIPHDVAILSRESVPLMEAIVPEITRYEKNQRQLVRYAVRTIDALSSHQPPGKQLILIMPRFIPGKTL